MHPSQRDLFGSGEIVKWLPDETVFSLSSRHHQLSGNQRAYVTCKQLFGHHQRGTEHDLPSRIDELVLRTQCQLGTAHEIIYRHTILPYYLPFKSKDTTEIAYAALQGDGIGHLKYKLGILTSRFGASHPLKACPKCLIADRAQFQVAYWHLEHQYPGAWTCLAHQCLLKMASVKANKIGRFLWFLPDESILHDAVIPSRLPCSTYRQLLPQLIALTNASVGLAHLPQGFCFDVERLLSVYLDAARGKGLLSSRNRLKSEAIGADFLQFARTLRSVPELSALPGSADEAIGQAARLLRMPRTGTHPVRHLCLILWLFDDWSSFWRKYQTTPTLSANHLPNSTENSPDSLRETFLKQIREDRSSISAAAHYVGISVNTGIEWAAQAGIPVPRRGKVVRSEIRELLIEELRRGESKPILAKRYGVSVQTVSRLLRSEMGLSDIWREACMRHNREGMRARWIKLCSDHPSSSTKMLRLLDPALYAWLYRNDRGWLKEHRACQPSGVRGNFSASSWQKRDSRLVNELIRASLSLSTLPRSCSLSLDELAQHVPALARHIHKLQHLPRTRSALERLLSMRTTFEVGNDLFSHREE